MCRSMNDATPGRQRLRCDHGWTAAHRAEVNKRRRERYKENKEATTAKASTSSATASPPATDETGLSGFQKEMFDLNSSINENIAAISKVNEDESRKRGVWPEEQYMSTIKAGHNRIRSKISKSQEKLAELAEQVDKSKAKIWSPDEQIKAEGYAELNDLNKKVVDTQSEIQRSIDKLDERERYNYGILSLENNDSLRLDLHKYDAREDISDAFTKQVTVVGHEKVDLSKVDYSSRNSVKTAIMAAGVKYPASSYWDEMGSSEKDMWEERQLKAIKRSQGG